VAAILAANTRPRLSACSITIERLDGSAVNEVAALAAASPGVTFERLAPNVLRLFVDGEGRSALLALIAAVLS
jgi:hypothetical protein